MNRRAFTLIELLVVVSIIGLLIAILLPSLAKARAAATKITCANNVRQNLLAVHMYSDAYKGSLPVEALSTTAYVWNNALQSMGGGGGAAGPAGMGGVFYDRVMTSFSTVFCP